MVRRLATSATIHWYGANPPVSTKHALQGLKGKVAFYGSGARTDAEVVADALKLKRLARPLLLCEVAEEAARQTAPRSELHRYCRDAVLAANRRFYFGDDIQRNRG